MELLLLALSALAIGGIAFSHDSDDDPESEPDPTPDPDPETPDFPPFSYTLAPETGEAMIHGSDAADLVGSAHNGTDADNGAYHELLDHLDEEGIPAASLQLGDGDDVLALTSSNAYTPDATIFAEDGNDSVSVIEDYIGGLDGGAGDDTLTVQGAYGASYTVEGGEGDDLITADGYLGNHDTDHTFDGDLHGGEGTDTITASGGALFGDAGNDHLTGDGGFTFDGQMEGGSGDDTLTVDMVVGVHETMDDGTGQLIEFTGSQALLSGGDGMDLFEITADIQTVREYDTPLALATISDFNPDADSLVLDIDGLAEGGYPDGLYSSGIPDGHGLSGPADTVADIQLVEDPDSGHTDIVVTAQGLSTDGETAITQDFTIRLEGVLGLDPAMLGYDPATMEIRLG